VKKILELLICFLHPIAVVLIWIDLLSRDDIGDGAKLAWAIFALVPLVPFIYVLVGGDLWLAARYKRLCGACALGRLRRQRDGVVDFALPGGQFGRVLLPVDLLG
jgi:hypothetical protein